MATAARRSASDEIDVIADEPDGPPPGDSEMTSCDERPLDDAGAGAAGPWIAITIGPLAPAGIRSRNVIVRRAPR